MPPGCSCLDPFHPGESRPNESTLPRGDRNSSAQQSGQLDRFTNSRRSETTNQTGHSRESFSAGVGLEKKFGRRSVSSDLELTGAVPLSSARKN